MENFPADSENYAARLESIEAQLVAGAKRMDQSETALDENTSMTRDVHAYLPVMRDIHDMLNAWRAGMNALASFGRGVGWLGRGIYKTAKVLTPIAAGVGAILAAWHSMYPTKGH